MVFLIFAARSVAQDVLGKRVSLTTTRISAGELRKEISRQTGLQFSFGSSTIRPGQLILLPQKNLTTRALLEAMKLQLQAEYKVYEDHVIFTKKKKSTVTEHGNISGERQPASHLPEKNALSTRHSPTNNSIVSPKEQSSSAAQDKQGFTSVNGNDNSHSKANTASGDASAATDEKGAASLSINDLRSSPSLQADERLRAKVYRPALRQATNPAPIPTFISAPSQQAAKDRYNLSGNFPLITRYTTAGIEASEYFTANAIFKGGIPLLHGIIGWSTTFAYSSLRYGAGTRWSFSEKWHAQANFTTGKVKDQSVMDSLSGPTKTLRITETLHRIGFQAERTLGKRWSLVAGISWNMLNRINTSDGTRLAPGDRIFGDMVLDKGFQLLIPTYTFSSKFHESSRVWKERWIGIQVGGYFRF